MAWKSNQIWFAKIRDKKNLLLKQFKNLDDSSGIYIIWRYDPTLEVGVCYIGQAKKCLERLAKHLLGYQAIDNSIRKHGIYEKDKNPNGYKFAIREHCSIELLDQKEKEWIEEYRKDGWILKNITGGGQIDKAGDINERKERKGYGHGREIGYRNGFEKGNKDGYKKGFTEGKQKGRTVILMEIKEFFDKYLDFVIKEPRLTKKKQPIVIKQKKYDEFKKLLSGETDELE